METGDEMNAQMEFVIATTDWPGWWRCPGTWDLFASLGNYNLNIVHGMKLVNAYNSGFKLTKSPIVAFVHDDVPVYEIGWDERVLKEFEDPTVGLVGFAGATGHGAMDIYQSPFEVNQFAREGFRSNLREA